jgi:hypothetical protein
MKIKIYTKLKKLQIDIEKLIKIIFIHKLKISLAKNYIKKTIQYSQASLIKVKYYKELKFQIYTTIEELKSTKIL